MSLTNNKLIWSYWEGPTNKILDKCTDSWFKYIPDWDIRILKKNDIHKYNFKLPTTFDNINLSMKSDLIRLNLLYNYGGVWLDATILLNDNLDWLIKFTDKYSINDYFQPKLINANYYESWFIVSPQKHNNNILKQLNLMTEIAEFFPEHYKTYIYKSNCNYAQNKKKYFLIYQIFCYLEQNDILFKSPIKIPINSNISLIIPFIPNSFIFPSTKLVKYVNGGKSHTIIYSIIINIIFIILIIISVKYLKNYFVL